MQLKIGRDISSYLLLEKQADVAVRAARSLREMVVDLDHASIHIEKLAKIEHEGDEFTHRLQNDIASHFITPLDKEDLRGLSQALDDITDSIEALASRMGIYRITKIREDFVPLTDLVVKASEEVNSAVAELKTGFHSESLRRKLENIHTYENQSDDGFRRALSDLFFDGIEPIEVMKWKEIYDRVEVTMDICEEVAKILGTIIVKYA